MIKICKNWYFANTKKINSALCNESCKQMISLEKKNQNEYECFTKRNSLIDIYKIYV